MPKWLRLILIILCVGLLVGVRAFETHLFYDPFILFFKGEYHSGGVPQTDFAYLLYSTTMRFIINSVLSLLILFFVFKNLDIVRFSGWLYFVLFVLLISVYCILYYTMEGNSQLLSMFFYIRRFLIQPIFLLLLLPAFYFFKRNNSQQ